MNEERVIKVVHYGDQDSRMFNDRITIEFSPSELSSLAIHFKQQALDAKDYGTQTFMREQREAFGRAYDLWEDYKRDNK